MITRTSATTSDDRAEALRSIMEATAAAVSTHAAKRAVVFRAAGRGESGVATDIRVGRHEVLIDEPPALGEVRVKVRLTGPASPEQYRQLQAAVDQQHCPVLDLFANPTSVHTELVAS
jgi:phage tail sheath gpL-like